MPRPARVTRFGRRGWLSGGTYTQATLTTALAGTNNDLKYTARTPGTAGNSVTITYVVAGASTPLTVTATGTAVTVNVATSAGSAATSTAAQVRDAVMSDDTPLVRQLIAGVELAPGNDGTGVVAAMGATALSGGTDTRTIGGGGGGWLRKRERGNNNLG